MSPIRPSELSQTGSGSGPCPGTRDPATNKHGEHTHTHTYTQLVGWFLLKLYLSALVLRAWMTEHVMNVTVRPTLSFHLTEHLGTLSKCLIYLFFFFFSLNLLVIICCCKNVYLRVKQKVCGTTKKKKKPFCWMEWEKSLLQNFYHSVFFNLNYVFCCFYFVFFFMSVVMQELNVTYYLSFLFLWICVALIVFFTSQYHLWTSNFGAEPWASLSVAAWPVS